MYAVTKMFEGYYFFGQAYPGIISFLAAAIFSIFILHALTAMRKFPSSYRQYRIFMSHTHKIQHDDTTLWFYQAATGFMMFFLGSVHLYMMMSTPSRIGPYASADRIYSEWMWPLYLLLLLSVIVHAAIGVYRLAMKWGIFAGKNIRDRRAKKIRKRIKKLMITAIVAYISIGLMSLATYMMIGYKHADRAGERYQPVTEVQQ